MILSMTGFGGGEVTENGTAARAEVSSVNGRFLDLKVKLPKFLAEYENDIRKIAQDYIDRGRVNVNVNVNVSGERAAGVRVDYELADRYAALAREFSERFGIANGLDARSLLTMPDVLVWEDDAVDGESLWSVARKAVVAAFENHRAMRGREGDAIGADMRTRLGNLGDRIGAVERRAPGIVKANTDRLRKKIETLVGSDSFDEVRFAMELAVYADRLDITEECVRFRSHTALFLAELDRERTSGRKLSFILQEMNREVNTIGSKVMDADTAAIVVLMKDELEKMREQAENME